MAAQISDEDVGHGMFSGRPRITLVQLESETADWSDA